MAIVSAATILALVPFVNKAFHIDDPLFLWAAKQIQKAPLDFYRFEVNWYGVTEPAFVVIKNPPLASYYIALVTKIGGWSETSLHLAFLLPAVACTAGVYLVARRFCSRPLLAALCCLFAPGFLVSSTTVMCDTMMLAFWIWAVVFWDKGLRQNSFGSTLFAAGLVGLAALVKYFGACLIPLLLVYGLVRQRRLGLWSVSLLLPLVMLGAYEWYTRRLYGHGLLSDAAAYTSHFSHRDFRHYSIAGLAFTGGCVFSPLCYTPLIWRKGWIVAWCISATVLWLILVTAGPAYLLGQINGDNMAMVSPQIAILATLGASILILPVVDFWQNRNADSLLLLLWVGGTFGFATLLNWTVSARTVLPICPAIAILLVRRLDTRAELVKRYVDGLLIGLLLPTAAMTLFVAAADYRLANSARSAALLIQDKRISSLGTLWFEGHWGFQYYMEAVGGEPLDHRRSVVENGDLLAIPASATNVFSLPKEVLRLTGVVEVGTMPFLATMDRSIGAGFYASEWGPLPFSFGPIGPQRYEIFSVIHQLHFVQPGDRQVR